MSEKLPAISPRKPSGKADKPPSRSGAPKASGKAPSGKSAGRTQSPQAAPKQTAATSKTPSPNKRVPSPGGKADGKKGTTTPRGKPSVTKDSLAQSAAADKDGEKKRKPGKPLQEALARTINADEDNARDLIFMEEHTAQSNLQLWMQSDEIQRIKDKTEQLLSGQEAIAERASNTSTYVTNTSANVDLLLREAKSISTTLGDFVARQEAAERARLGHLEVENAMLKRDKEQLSLQLERMSSDSQALRETLLRQIVKAQTEYDHIRSAVHDEIHQHTVNFDKLRSDLIVKMETSVLNFHKDSFESNLESLRESLKETRAHVEAQQHRLRMVVDSIGAEDESVHAMSMHTNLPQYYRRELQHFTREQMLSLIDILSFENGVVAAVGRAVHAKGRTNTQNVFN